MASTTQESTIISTLRELAGLERFDPDGTDRWPLISSTIPAWHPRLEGDAGADAGGDGGDGGDSEGDAGDAGGKGGEGDGDAGAERVERDDDWQTKARKHESRSKRLERENARLKREAEERAAADLTDQERAIQEAREAGKSEAATAAQLERRTDRLENQVYRHAAAGFTDVEDAWLNIERAVARGDLELDDLVDDAGKVNQDALKSELDDLLKRKPQLAKGAGNGNGNGHGSADGGAGSGAAGTIETASVEDHMRRQGRIK